MAFKTMEEANDPKYWTTDSAGKSTFVGDGSQVNGFSSNNPLLNKDSSGNIAPVVSDKGFSSANPLLNKNEQGIVTPVDTSQAKEATKTLSSGLAEDQKALDAKRIAELEAQSKEQQQLAKDMLSSQTADIEQSYAKQEAEARENYANQEGTQDVLSYRLGTSGTPYAAAEKSKIQAKKQQFFNTLESEKTSKLTALKQAYLDNNYKAVSSLREQIYKIQSDQQKFLQDERRSQLDETKTLLEIAKTTNEIKKDQAFGDFEKVDAGQTLYNPKTGEIISIPKPIEGTTDTKNYEYYVAQQNKAKVPALDFDTWYANQKAPASYKEYLIAQKNGYTGSMLEYEQQKKGIGAQLDADTLRFMAEKYVIDGKMPSFGYGASGTTARYQFFKAVADAYGDKGLTVEQANAQRLAKTSAASALTKVKTLSATTEMAENAAITNLELAAKLGRDYQRAGMPVVNRFQNWLNGNLGDTKLSAFETALYTGAREYAKVASGAAGSVSGLTESATKEAERMVNAAMTQGQLESTLKTMKMDMKNVREAQEDQMAALEAELATPVVGQGATSVNTPNNVSTNSNPAPTLSIPKITAQQTNDLNSIFK